MNIVINKKFRLHKWDSKNMELEEFRMPEERATNKDKERAEKWIGTGHYFQNLGSALIWILDHRMINDNGECVSINDAINRMQKIVDELKQIKIED